MRKIIHRYTVLLLTVLLVGTGIALADTDVVVLGDVNSDGSVTTADVTALVNYLHGSGTVDVVAADVNRDGDIDIADVTAINNIISSGTFDKGTASTLFFPAATVNKTYGDVAFTNPIVRSGSKGAITYESSAPGVATVNTTTGEVTIMGAGTATITATLAANGGISGTTASYTLNVAKVAAGTDPSTTMTTSVFAKKDGENNQSYTGGALPLVTAGVSSAGTVYYKVTPTNEKPTSTEGFSASVPTATAAGTYYVWYYAGGNENYNETAISGTSIEVVIDKATPTYTAPAFSALTYTGEAQNLVSAGSSEHGTFTYSTTEDGTYTEAVPQGTAAGSYTVWYKFTGDANHNDVAATEVTGISIAKAPSTTDPSTTMTTAVSAKKNGGDNQSYTGEALYLVTAGTSSAGTVYYKVTTTDEKPTSTEGFSDAVPTAENAGTYYVWYYAGGNENYNETAISGTSIEVVIDKATITPSVTMSDWTYGEEASSPSVSGNTGNGSVTYQYKVSGADDGTYSGTEPATPGTYTVKATIAETTNYNGNSATAEFTIASGTLTVTASDYSGAYDGEAHGITVTCEGATVKYGETEGTYNLDASPTLTNVGTKTVYYQVTKENYTTVEGSKTVTITAVAATVTTAPAAVSGDLTYTGGALTLFNAGSVTGGTLMYKVTTSSTKPASTADFTITIPQQTNAGTYYLWYYVEGDGNHNSTEINATGVSKTISKAPATLTCSTAALSFAASGKANATATKTEVSCSGGTINVSSSNGSYCTVSYSSGTITVTRVSEAAWSAIITVSVTPDGNHTAPSNVQFTVSGTACDPGIAASSVTSSHVGYVLAANGKIYETVAAATSANTTAVAMIAYVGNKSNCTHGLAIALEDVSSNTLSWGNSGSNNGGKTASELVTSWGNSHSVSGGTWRLPSVDDWKYMFEGCGGASYSSSLNISSTPYSYGNFREKLKALNNSYDVRSGGYWSGSGFSTSAADRAWGYNFVSSNFAGRFRTELNYVRACYAF